MCAWCRSVRQAHCKDARSLSALEVRNPRALPFGRRARGFGTVSFLRAGLLPRLMLSMTGMIAFVSASSSTDWQHAAEGREAAAAEIARTEIDRDWDAGPHASPRRLITDFTKRGEAKVEREEEIVIGRIGIEATMTLTEVSNANFAVRRAIVVISEVDLSIVGATTTDVGAFFEFKSLPFPGSAPNVMPRLVEAGTGNPSRLKKELVRQLNNTNTNAASWTVTVDMLRVVRERVYVPANWNNLDSNGETIPNPSPTPAPPATPQPTPPSGATLPPTPSPSRAPSEGGSSEGGGDGSSGGSSGNGSQDGSSGTGSSGNPDSESPTSIPSWNQQAYSGSRRRRSTRTTSLTELSDEEDASFLHLGIIIGLIVFVVLVIGGLLLWGYYNGAQGSTMTGCTAGKVINYLPPKRENSSTTITSTWSESSYSTVSRILRGLRRTPSRLFRKQSRVVPVSSSVGAANTLTQASLSTLDLEAHQGGTCPKLSTSPRPDLARHVSVSMSPRQGLSPRVSGSPRHNGISPRPYETKGARLSLPSLAGGTTCHFQTHSDGNSEQANASPRSLRSPRLAMDVVRSPRVDKAPRRASLP
eukprot:TRINITY_DN21438_c0_g1_i1.p1 TRINITY_DN21438_c0_g1~~TRINITY_DN21438_c0_g1_i1.p1  ORF type:complete len:587 (+),score=52.49 TRINITY_DN21438_c0_g1_i1:77-1837(+)